MSYPQQQNDNTFDYNFGQGNIPQYGPPPQPNRTGRVILLGMASVFLCVCVFCLCVGVVLYSAREAVPAQLWVQMVNRDILEDATSLNVVCPGSQAEAFTERFMAAYPNAEITLDNSTEMEGGDNLAIVKGTLTADNTDFDYEAEFITDPDGEKFFLIFSCITEIRQISPPLDVEDNLFGG